MVRRVATGSSWALIECVAPLVDVELVLTRR
jgi:hypothetical protein